MSAGIEYVAEKPNKAHHALVEQHHYSARAVRNSSIAAAAYDSGVLVGVCLLFSPAARWSERVLELCRLVRSPASEASCTKLISIAAKAAKAQGHHLLVSYADKREGHHGGVYQAASWKYHGVRARSPDGVKIDGVFTPRRSCNEVYGTSSTTKLRLLLPGRAIEDVVDEGKHLYWRALTKEGLRRAARLKLLAGPYPKDPLFQ